MQNPAVIAHGVNQSAYSGVPSIKSFHAFLNVGLAQFIHEVPSIIVGILIFIVFWISAILVKWCFIRIANKQNRRRYLFGMMGSIVKMTIIVIGMITALGTMGLNVTALVTGAGLTGFAVGLAMKDPLSNILSGFMVLLYEPFRPGDYLVVNTNEGEVVDINLRYTVLHSTDKVTMIPNATMLTSALIVKQPNHQ